MKSEKNLTYNMLSTASRRSYYVSCGSFLSYFLHFIVNYYFTNKTIQSQIIRNVLSLINILLESYRLSSLCIYIIFCQPPSAFMCSKLVNKTLPSKGRVKSPKGNRYYLWTTPNPVKAKPTKRTGSPTPGPKKLHTEIERGRPKLRMKLRLLNVSF